MAMQGTLQIKTTELSVDWTPMVPIFPETMRRNVMYNNNQIGRSTNGTAPTATVTSSTNLNINGNAYHQMGDPFCMEATNNTYIFNPNDFEDIQWMTRPDSNWLLDNGGDTYGHQNIVKAEPVEPPQINNIPGPNHTYVHPNQNIVKQERVETPNENVLPDDGDHYRAFVHQNLVKQERVESPDAINLPGGSDHLYGYQGTINIERIEPLHVNNQPGPGNHIFQPQIMVKNERMEPVHTNDLPYVNDHTYVDQNIVKNERIETPLANNFPGMGNHTYGAVDGPENRVKMERVEPVQANNPPGPRDGHEMNYNIFDFMDDIYPAGSNYTNNYYPPSGVSYNRKNVTANTNNMKVAASGSGITIRNVNQLNAAPTATATTAERPNAVPMRTHFGNVLEAGISPFGSGTALRNFNNILAAPTATVTVAATSNNPDIDIDAFLNEYLPTERAPLPPIDIDQARINEIKAFLNDDWNATVNNVNNLPNNRRKNNPNAPRATAPAIQPPINNKRRAPADGFLEFATNPQIKRSRIALQPQRTDNVIYGQFQNNVMYPPANQPAVQPHNGHGNVNRNKNQLRLQVNNFQISEFIDLTENTTPEGTVPKMGHLEKPVSANYLQLLQMEESMGIVPNCEEFECTICFTAVVEKEGVMLRNCLHSFCRECISQLIVVNEPCDVKCPFIENDKICGEELQDREIRGLLTKEQYEEYLVKSLRTAENTAADAFHCRQPNCTGWIFYDPNVTRFYCPTCGAINCIQCKVSRTAIFKSSK